MRTTCIALQTGHDPLSDTPAEPPSNQDQLRTHRPPFLRSQLVHLVHVSHALQDPCSPIRRAQKRLGAENVKLSLQAGRGGGGGEASVPEQAPYQLVEATLDGWEHRERDGQRRDVVRVCPAAFLRAVRVTSMLKMIARRLRSVGERSDSRRRQELRGSAVDVLVENVREVDDASSGAVDQRSRVDESWRVSEAQRGNGTYCRVLSIASSCAGVTRSALLRSRMSALPI